MVAVFFSLRPDDIGLAIAKTIQTTFKNEDISYV